MRPADLSKLVAERLQIAGVDSLRLERATDRIQQVHWTRPPLFTDLMFDGKPLQNWLNIEVGVDFEGFVAAYEEFLQMQVFGRPKFGTISWASRALGITRSEATLLFSDGSPRKGRRRESLKQRLLNTVAFAALAKMNYPLDEETEGPATYVVGVGGYRFGVDCGKVYTNLGRSKGLSARITVLRHNSSLLLAGRTNPIRTQDTTTSNLSRVWALAAAATDNVGGENPEAFKFAVNFLWWCSRGQEYAAINQAIAPGHVKSVVQQALHLARGFENFSAPYAQVQELLKPFMRPEEFRERFGYSPKGPLSLQRRQQWYMALDQLAHELLEQE